MIQPCDAPSIKHILKLRCQMEQKNLIISEFFFSIGRTICWNGIQKIMEETRKFMYLLRTSGYQTYSCTTSKSWLLCLKSLQDINRCLNINMWILLPIHAFLFHTWHMLTLVGGFSLNIRILLLVIWCPYLSWYMRFVLMLQQGSLIGWLSDCLPD